MSKLILLINNVSKRYISFSKPCEGKRNFRKFLMPNKRGTVLHKKQQTTEDRALPVDLRGVRATGYRINGRYVTFPEMIPELIVPNLAGCDLKPYVSYKAPEVTQSEFTAEQLFNVIYAEKIVKDFKQGNLDDMGYPKEPSPYEELTPEKAFIKARSTGSDIFTNTNTNSKPSGIE